jgi:hypothetical protein
MIPKLIRITSVTQDEISGSVVRSVIHNLFVMMDAMLGIFGGHIPFVTISTRCALAILNAQEKGTPIPFWAKALGSMLETKWAIPFISYPGHLQDAMVGDFARCQYVQNLIKDAS